MSVGHAWVMAPGTSSWPVYRKSCSMGNSRRMKISAHLLILLIALDFVLKEVYGQRKENTFILAVNLKPGAEFPFTTDRSIYEGHHPFRWRGSRVVERELVYDVIGEGLNSPRWKYFFFSSLYFTHFYWPRQSQIASVQTKRVTATTNSYSCTSMINGKALFVRHHVW